MDYIKNFHKLYIQTVLNNIPEGYIVLHCIDYLQPSMLRTNMKIHIPQTLKCTFDIDQAISQSMQVDRTYDHNNPNPYHIKPNPERPQNLNCIQ